MGRKRTEVAKGVGDSWKRRSGLLVCFKMFDPDGCGFSNRRADTDIRKNKHRSAWGMVVRQEAAAGQAEGRACTSHARQGQAEGNAV